MIKVTEGGENQPQYLVRGSSQLVFHKDIYEDFIRRELTDEERLDLNMVQVKGGGRVRFSEDHILVYSYSQVYGRLADQAKAG
jgi:hypothetical protein